MLCSQNQNHAALSRSRNTGQRGGLCCCLMCFRVCILVMEITYNLIQCPLESIENFSLVSIAFGSIPYFPNHYTIFDFSGISIPDAFSRDACQAIVRYHRLSISVSLISSNILGLRSAIENICFLKYCTSDYIATRPCLLPFKSFISRRSLDIEVGKISSVT